MKAIAYLVANSEQLIEAERLSLPQKMPVEFIEAEIFFPVKAVALAFLIEGGKKIKVLISGRELVLKFEEELWKKIQATLEYA